MCLSFLPKFLCSPSPHRQPFFTIGWVFPLVFVLLLLNISSNWLLLSSPHHLYKTSQLFMFYFCLLAISSFLPWSSNCIQSQIYASCCYICLKSPNARHTKSNISVEWNRKCNQHPFQYMASLRVNPECNLGMPG